MFTLKSPISKIHAEKGLSFCIK